MEPTFISQVAGMLLIPVVLWIFAKVSAALDTKPQWWESGYERETISEND